jgi:hypothetical protein
MNQQKEKYYKILRELKQEKNHLQQKYEQMVSYNPDHASSIIIKKEIEEYSHSKLKENRIKYENQLKEILTIFTLGPTPLGTDEIPKMQYLSEEVQKLKDIIDSKNITNKLDLKLVKESYPTEIKNKIIDDIKNRIINNDSSVRPGIKIDIVDANDPRVSLRNQNKVITTEFIPKYTIIAPYSGILTTEKFFVEKFPKNSIERLRHDAYSFAIHTRPKNHRLMLDGYGYGNETMCINDFRLDPFSNNVSSQEPLQPNTSFIEVKVNKWPYIFVISITDILPGSELLVDYGERFWSNFRDSYNLLQQFTEYIKDCLKGTKEFPFRIS